MTYQKIYIYILFICSVLYTFQTNAFCGFYVARADSKLFNKASQVILVREGSRNIITMSSDYQGDLKDFAMVVPVPKVLQKEDIRIADRHIFETLDAYSAPRLVEYHDKNPCLPLTVMNYTKSKFENKNLSIIENQVVIEAKYAVGEYDILILSAKESNSLETWLTAHGYQIPQKAQEVLSPYIKDKMKFFVVKVNIERKQNEKSQLLNPLQISYTSEKFMLPIRLGMANAKDYQDLIIYAFTKKGRIESTNYRTVPIPSNKKVPLFIKDKFDQFYQDLFKTHWHNQGKNIISLEYAWNLSSSNYLKCDPCASVPPTYEQLREAGVYWVKEATDNWGRGANYDGDVFFTRLHVRYDRKHFPQDLLFQITPNKQHVQGRYILNNPVFEALDCEKKFDYYQNVTHRREKELENLHELTRWNIKVCQNYIDEFKNKTLNKKTKKKWFEFD